MYASPSASSTPMPTPLIPVSTVNPTDSHPGMLAKSDAMNAPQYRETVTAIAAITSTFA